MATSKNLLKTAVLGLIILFIVVILVIFRGNARTHSSQFNSSNLPTGDVAAISTPQGTYLDILQLGVKFSLNTGVKDAVYAPFNVSSEDQSEAYGVSTLGLMNAGGNEGCTPAAGPLGLIVATSNAPQVPDSSNNAVSLTPDNKTLFKIGSKYYHYIPPQNQGCFGGSVTSVLIQDDQTALAQSFASLQLDSESAGQ